MGQFLVHDQQNGKLIGRGTSYIEAGKQDSIYGPTAIGVGVIQGEYIVLSKLIGVLNDRFGTEFKSGHSAMLVLSAFPSTATTITCGTDSVVTRLTLAFYWGR